MIRLQLPAQLAERREFVGRIKNQEATQLRVFDDRNSGFVFHFVRQLHSQNLMVKPPDHRGTVGGSSSPLGIDLDVERFDANFVQHRTHERCFIFAISVAMREDLGGGVRLPASNSPFDGHIPYISLNKLGQRLHLRQLGRRGSRESGHLLLDFGRGISPPLFKPCFPIAHLFPILKPLSCSSPWWHKCNYQDSGDPPPWRHIVLASDSFNVTDDPLHLISSLCRLGFWVVYPRSFVFPARGKLQSVMGFSDGIRSLKVPNILQDEWLLFLFILIAHNIPRIGRRNAQEFVFNVGYQLAPFNFRQGNLDGFLILYFIVLALRRDTPAAHARDL